MQNFAKQENCFAELCLCCLFSYVSNHSLTAHVRNNRMTSCDGAFAGSRCVLWALEEIIYTREARGGVI